MTDLTLPLALVVSVGLAVVFYVKWRQSVRDLASMTAQSDRNLKRAWTAENDLYDVRAVLRDTEKALAGKVAAEFHGGDPEGPVAA
jgi:hypothetical protein